MGALDLLYPLQNLQFQSKITSFYSKTKTQQKKKSLKRILLITELTESITIKIPKRKKKLKKVDNKKKGYHRYRVDPQHRHSEDLRSGRPFPS